MYPQISVPFVLQFNPSTVVWSSSYYPELGATVAVSGPQRKSKVTKPSFLVVLGDCVT